MDARPGGTHRSVEFKHMNISAVLDMSWATSTIRGYKPKANYQRSILQAIERLPPASERHVGDDAGRPSAAEPPSLFLRLRRRLLPPKARPEERERLVRKFDARRARLPGTGRWARLRAQAAVFEFERQQPDCSDEERPDLARKVRWVAQEDGDGAGYDIHSFEPRRAGSGWWR